LGSNRRTWGRGKTHFTLRLALGKARKERAWSALTIAILVGGLTSWMVFPSLGSGLQNGTGAFEASAATYLYVQPTNPGGLQPRIPPNILSSIKALPDVAGVNAFTTQEFAIQQNGQVILPNGTAIQGQNLYGISSVSLGNGGLPARFVGLAQGRLPSGNQAEVALTHGISNFSIGQTVTVQAGVDGVGPVFNVTVVGFVAQNPFLEHTETAFWNATFLGQKLGSGLYTNLFGPNTTNSMVIKATSALAVRTLAGKVGQMLGEGFAVSYDASLAQSLEAFQAQAAPLYEAIGIVSVGFSALLVFFASYLVVGRRGWEIGIYLSQGLSPGQVAKLLFYYFSLLGLTAFMISALFSYILLSWLSFGFESVGGTTYVAISTSPVFLVSGIPLALVLGGFATGATMLFTRRTGTDLLLRDY
jgi:FtsX-like permease family/MacB-like periplasmic core domain